MFGINKKNSLRIALAKAYAGSILKMPALHTSSGSLGECRLDADGSRSIGADPLVAEEINRIYGPDSMTVIFAHEDGHDEYNR